MAISFKPGTFVELKSGGPKMIVSGEEIGFGGGTGRVVCEWFDKLDEPRSKAFSETSLKAVEEDFTGVMIVPLTRS